MSSLREQSRIAFNDNQITHENVRTGSLQRIADACELIAKDRQQLLSDLDSYKKLAEKRHNTIRELEKEIINLKKVKTRYKNQLADSKIKASMTDLQEKDLQNIERHGESNN